MDAFLARVYAAGGAKDIDPEIINATATELKKALKKGYKNDFKDFDVNSPDFAMLANLESNIYQFAAAKNYQEMRLLTDSLTNEAGELISFTEFREVAEKQFLKFNEDWLESEYSTAISGSMSAARWVDYTRSAKAMPFLRYTTVGDRLVRDSHAVLDGTVKRIDDIFWDNYYPPNGWRCRCTTTQTGNSRETPDGAIVYPEVPDLWKTNLAKQGLMFPKNHPYFDGVPREVLRKALAYLPPDNTYRTVRVGKVLIDVHPMHGAEELEKNLKASAMVKRYDSKAKIKLLPVLNENEEHLRSRFYPLGSPKGKNADSLIGEKVVDFKEVVGSKSSIQHAIKSGKEQCRNVYIVIPDNISVDDTYRFVKGKLNHYKGDELDEIWLMNNKGRLVIDGKGAIKQKQALPK